MASSYEYTKASVDRRREWARTLKDKPCSKCGEQLEPERMHWHHRDPATKEFRVALGVFRASRARILAEIAKCDLLCEPCHDELHGGEHQAAACGTTRAYWAGCRCSECRAAATK
jgi:hypothetical protein